MSKLTIVCARYNEDIHWMLPIIENAVIYNKGNNNLDYIPKNKVIHCENIGREGGTYIKHIIDNYSNLSDHIMFLQGNPIDHIYHNYNDSINEIYSIVNEDKPYHFKYISKWLVPVHKDEVLDYSSGISSVSMDLIHSIEINKIIEILVSIPNSDKIKYAEINDFLNNLILQKIKNQFIKLYELTNIIIKYDSYFFHTTEGCVFQKKIYNLFDNGNDFIKMFETCNYSYGSGAMFIVHKKQILRRPIEFWKQLNECLQEISPPAGYGLEKLWPIIM